MEENKLFFMWYDGQRWNVCGPFDRIESMDGLKAGHPLGIVVKKVE